MDPVITSLRDIPKVLFSEFAITDEPDKQTFTDGGHKTIIKACFAQRSGPDRPHTLVYHDHHDGYGKRHSTKLEVYRQPVQIFQFNEKLKVSKPDPKLSIVFCAQDFDVREPHPGTPWQEGRGYWVEESLLAWYGDFPSGCATINSNQADWEFQFLLDIQKMAHGLAHQVESRGHWQSEWEVGRDYSKKIE